MERSSIWFRILCPLIRFPFKRGDCAGRIYQRSWIYARTGTGLLSDTGTISTCMYYTGLDPRTMKEVYVPVTLKEKQMQRALIQYRNPENYDIVKARLIKAGREDLIGFDEHCLIPPRKMGHNYHPGKKVSADNTAKSKDGRADTRKYTKPKSGKPQNMKSKQFKTDKYKTGKDRPEDFKAGRQKNEKYKTDRFTGKTQERGKSKKKTIRNIHTRKKCR